MNRLRKYLAFFAGVVLLLGANSCQNEDLELFEENKNYRNAADFIRNSFGLTLFYAGLEKAGLLDELRGDGLVTVFAPNDDAFHALGIRTPSDFDRLDQDSLRFMLQYHLLEQPLFTTDVPERAVDNRYLTKNGKELYVAGYNDGPEWKYYYANGARLQSPDQVLANGVLHVIDKALKYQEVTLQEALEDRVDLHYFVTALKQFGYWDQLAQEGPWIVFAPRNEAFEKHGISLADIQTMNPDDYLPRLFGSYIFSNKIFISDLHVIFRSSTGYPRYNGNNVMIPIPGDEEVSSGFYQNSSGGSLFLQESLSNSNVPISEVALSPSSRTDYLVDNGIWHEVEDLLVLPVNALREF